MAMTNCIECNGEVSSDAPVCPHCGKKDPTETIWDKIGNFMLGVGIVALIIWWSPWESNKKVKVKRISTSQTSLQEAVKKVAANQINSKDKSDNNSIYSHEVRKKTMKPTEQIIRVNIKDILLAYKNNEVGADIQYKGKLIQTTGIINSVKKDFSDNIYVVLGTNTDFEWTQFRAEFVKTMNEQIAKLQKGSQLTVVCRIYGMSTDVKAKECIIKNGYEADDFQHEYPD